MYFWLFSLSLSLHIYQFLLLFYAFNFIIIAGILSIFSMFKGIFYPNVFAFYFSSPLLYYYHYNKSSVFIITLFFLSLSTMSEFIVQNNWSASLKKDWKMNWSFRIIWFFFRCINICLRLNNYNHMCWMRETIFNDFQKIKCQKVFTLIVVDDDAP